MDLLTELVAWLTDPANWQGPRGVPARTGEHAGYSLTALLGAAVVAVPVGLATGHTGRGGVLAVNVANIGRAVPTFGAIVLLATVLGFGFLPPFLALVAFAIPPILTNTHTGVREIDDHVRDAAEGMGMRGWQVLWRVEIPGALPLVVAGLRTAAVQLVATATLAAFVGLGGLGAFVFGGLARQNGEEILAGALLVAVLALVVEAVLARLQRRLVPAGLRQRAEQAATETKLRQRTA